MVTTGMSGAAYYEHPEFYDLEGERAGPDQADVRFFVAYARRTGRALELGAGTGRVAVWIADVGVPVHCVEPSPAMRSALLVKVTQQPRWQPYVTVVPGEAATVDLGQRFPFVYAAGVVQHFLTDEELLAVLRNAARHLEPGGCFVCDNVRPRPRAAAQPPTCLGEQRIGEMRYRATYATEPLSDEYYRATTVYETLHGEAVVERDEVTSVDRAIPRATMHRLLAEAGLAVAREFADYDRTPYHPGAEQVIIEARKVRSTNDEVRTGAV
jgi:SAM-dependent methyltransferase